MFEPPQLSKTLVYFGDTADVAKLHAGETFSTRLEEEIRIHQGQIHAENLLLNTVAHYQHIASENGIAREDFHQLLRDSRYRLADTKNILIERFGIDEAAFDQPLGFDPVDTADYMRHRATMIGAVLSSTPVLLRDPWDGKPVTAQYGFSDFKAEIDGIGFSAIATPRYKGIPFRFAVMKHEHDGYTDNNPAMIMSNEFCDAFELYNKEKYGSLPPSETPLLQAMATNLKPNIHDRFHNWLLYDVKAASETFKQWTNDIYFVEHADKNPLLINYEYVAMCFHLYGYQVLFEKNPAFKSAMYDRLETCIGEIEDFGSFLKERDYPKADEIKESTVYAVLSNICFVLNPYEDRFRTILENYPDVRQKMLEVRQDGRGIGGTLERLHGYEDDVPSLKYGGAKEAAIEYILRYPLADEIRAKLKVDRSHGKPDDWEMVDGKRIYTMNLESYNALPPLLKERLGIVRDSGALAKINDALQAMAEDQRQNLVTRTEVSEEGYFFLRLDRSEIDYAQFETHEQLKKVLLVDIPAGEEVRFVNEKRLSITDHVKKQEFCLIGGKDLLAINVRDEQAAAEILAHAQTADGVDSHLALGKAKELALMTGEKSSGDMYKIRLDVAQQLYGFRQSGYYQATLQKDLAGSPGPIVMQLQSGGDQRLVKGAFVYLPLGKDPAQDKNPDCHMIENTDYKRDYASESGTDALPPVHLKPNAGLEAETVTNYLKVLQTVNFQITHGPSRMPQFANDKLGLFS